MLMVYNTHTAVTYQTVGVMYVGLTIWKSHNEVKNVPVITTMYCVREVAGFTVKSFQRCLVNKPKRPS